MANVQCSSFSTGRAPEICFQRYLIIRAAHQSRTTIETAISKYISLSTLSTDSTPQTRHFNRASRHKISPQDPLVDHFFGLQMDIHRRLFQSGPNTHSPTNKHQILPRHSRYCVPLGKRLLRIQRRFRSSTSSIHPFIAALSRGRSTRRPKRGHLLKRMAKRHSRRAGRMDLPRERTLGDDAERQRSKHCSRRVV